MTFFNQSFVVALFKPGAASADYQKTISLDFSLDQAYSDMAPHVGEPSDQGISLLEPVLDSTRDLLALRTDLMWDRFQMTTVVDDAFDLIPPPLFDRHPSEEEEEEEEFEDEEEDDEIDDDLEDDLDDLDDDEDDIDDDEDEDLSEIDDIDIDEEDDVDDDLDDLDDDDEDEEDVEEL